MSINLEVALARIEDLEINNAKLRDAAQSANRAAKRRGEERDAAKAAAAELRSVLEFLHTRASHSRYLGFVQSRDYAAELRDLLAGPPSAQTDREKERCLALAKDHAAQRIINMVLDTLERTKP